MAIAITTPTGNIGSRVVERLLEQGSEVAVLVRHPDKLPEEVRGRVRVHQGDLRDAEFVRRATEGAESLFFLVPPDFATTDWRGFQLGIGEAGAEAIRRNGIERVVFISSAGAHRDDLFAISRLGEIEQMLNGAAPHVLSLRAGFFFENFFAAVPTIAEMDTVFMGFSPETRTPMVATRDIGDVAAAALRDRSWSGHQVRGVHGPAHLSFAEATGAIGEGIGRELRYVQVPIEQVRAGFASTGASEHVVDEYTRMFQRLEEIGFEGEPRTPESTTPTTMEQWAREVLQPAVQAAPVGAA